MKRLATAITLFTAACTQPIPNNHFELPWALTVEESTYQWNGESGTRLTLHNFDIPYSIDAIFTDSIPGPEEVCGIDVPITSPAAALGDPFFLGDLQADMSARSDCIEHNDHKRCYYGKHDLELLLRKREDLWLMDHTQTTTWYSSLTMKLLDGEVTFWHPNKDYWAIDLVGVRQGSTLQGYAHPQLLYERLISSR